MSDYREAHRRGMEILRDAESGRAAEAERDRAENACPDCDDKAAEIARLRGQVDRLTKDRDIWKNTERYEFKKHVKSCEEKNARIAELEAEVERLNGVESVQLAALHIAADAAGSTHSEQTDDMIAGWLHEAKHPDGQHA